MFDQVDRQELSAAIAEAEKGHRGEVRVHLERCCPEASTPRERAAELFASFGMNRTREDTAVLLYVCCDAGQCAVHAGSGVRDAAKVGFWQAVAVEIERGFSIGEPLAGICAGVEQVGEMLREHVPGEDVAGNELPDAVTTS
jgi:uncharacterized membrane protein